MARSSRRRGANMPGVSTKMSWATPSIAIPRRSARVVCTLGVTIETLDPTSALVSVDFPTLGAPISATTTQRRAASSAIAPFGFNAFARQHRCRSGLLGGALGAARPLRRREVRQLHGDPEFGAVVGAGARHFPVGGRRQATSLRPFLQHGLGIAQRL